MKRIKIDINCDVGEGMGNEEELFAHISSCNIACGGHAGDLALVRQLTILSKRHSVKVGAHPSYPDRENFGRVSLDLSKDQLKMSIRDQLAGFTEVLEHEKVSLHHIKPHGALYNDIACSVGLARIFLDAIEQFRNRVMLYVPYGSSIENEALVRGFKIAREAFGDRNYNDDLSLVSRKKANSLIEEPKAVLDHVISMIRDNKVITATGKSLKIKADTICIHGDTPSALQILAYLTSELTKYNIEIKK